jgi:CBS domain containing-hemolysin-like protein
MSFLFILLLVLINAFFVAAEFALVKVRYSQIELMAQSGNKNAKLSQNILDNLDEYLSASQLGITVASLALWWVGEAALAHVIPWLITWIWFTLPELAVHSIAVSLSFIPKSFAIRYPLETTLVIARPLKIFYTIFKPLIWSMNKISLGILRLFGIAHVQEDEIHSEEELRMILAESQEWWAIQRSEHELIQNVFDFDDRTVKQIMCNVHDIIAIDAKFTTDEVMEFITREWYSRYPVYEWDIDTIIGVVHAKDIFKQYISTHKINLKSILKQIHFVPWVQKVHDLLKLFQKSHKHMAVVTSEFGTTLGIVSMEDILEELVGEIQDESDNETPLIEQIKDDEYLVDAMIGVIDANDILPRAIPDHDSYQTISWYINHLWGCIPHEGQEMDADGYHIKIVKRTKQRVELVRMKIL